VCGHNDASDSHVLLHLNDEKNCSDDDVLCLPDEMLFDKFTIIHALQVCLNVILCKLQSGGVIIIFCYCIQHDVHL
jgi:hypothetical protein